MVRWKEKWWLGLNKNKGTAETSVHRVSAQSSVRTKPKPLKVVFDCPTAGSRPMPTSEVMEFVLCTDVRVFSRGGNRQTSLCGVARAGVGATFI
ncbi:unnamed protein product [Periconia digitata]|uniref:Uncharacterized protein n=1 Tax=Periconia digitata TaxID=1303443 RepID=A0A9W4UCS3_9PLEO|nr:unnamed protein product [Periconia digitata]